MELFWTAIEFLFSSILRTTIAMLPHLPFLLFVSDRQVVMWTLLHLVEVIINLTLLFLCEREERILPFDLRRKVSSRLMFTQIQSTINTYI